MHPETTRGLVVALTIAVALVVTAAPAVADIHDEWLARAHDVAMWRFPFVCQPINYDDIHNPVDNVGWYGVARVGGNPCTVYLNPAWRTWRFEFLCEIVAHEVGHLSGLRHSSDFRSIMYPYRFGIPWRPCVRAAALVGAGRRTHAPPTK